MKKFYLALALAASASLASATTIVFDDFSVAQGPLNLGDGTPTQSAAGIGTGVAGVSRALTFIPVAGAPPVQRTAQVTSGVLDITNGTGDDSQLVVTYTLPQLAPPGSTGVQLTLQIVGSDANPISVTAGGLATGSFNIGANFSGLITFTLAAGAFGPGTMTLTFDGNPGWDLTVDSLGLDYTPPNGVVPEPATYGLMSAALFGFYLIRRKS